MLLFAACSRETPAPPQPAATTSERPAASATAPAAPVPPKTATYEDALTWFRSTPGFRFELRDGDFAATGKMTRTTIGAEAIELSSAGTEWRASASARGITWEQKRNGRWTVTDPPPFGNRVYQRLTLAIDPQKKERAAQLAGTEGDANHYRFTDANSGEVHDVWVARSDGHIQRMTIGETFELKITP